MIIAVCETKSDSLVVTTEVAPRCSLKSGVDADERSEKLVRNTDVVR